MTTIYLIRHAEAEGNLYRRIHGWYDARVTPNGMRQIQALEQRFFGVNVDAVYSSDLYRTKTTAKAICVPKGLPLQLDSDLREIHMGAWEDHTWGEVKHFDGPRLDQFNRSDPSWCAPEGESLGQVGVRVEEAVRRIAVQHPEQTIAVVTHGTAIRQMVARVRGIAPEQWHTLPHSDNTAVTCLAFDGTNFHVIYEGDNTHLDDSTSTLAHQFWWANGQKGADINLWFRPMAESEREVYLAAQRDAWISIHGTSHPFDANAFWQDALNSMAQDPQALCAAMDEDNLAGIVQLNPSRFADEGVGFLSFCYMTPAYRGKGLGVQLIGHATSFYRRQNRTALRLRCSPTNELAQHFYAKYGFVNIGHETIGPISLDLLEQYIGYEEPETL